MSIVRLRQGGVYPVGEIVVAGILGQGMTPRTDCFAPVAQFGIGISYMLQYHGIIVGQNRRPLQVR